MGRRLSQERNNGRLEDPPVPRHRLLSWNWSGSMKISLGHNSRLRAEQEIFKSKLSTVDRCESTDNGFPIAAQSSVLRVAIELLFFIA
jgi:hypothetical protein